MQHLQKNFIYNLCWCAVKKLLTHSSIIFVKMTNTQKTDFNLTRKIQSAGLGHKLHYKLNFTVSCRPLNQIMLHTCHFHSNNPSATPTESVFYYICHLQTVFTARWWEIGMCSENLQNIWFCIDSAVRSTEHKYLSKSTSKRHFFTEVKVKVVD